ncbi:MAG: hypothetical protein Q8L27_00595 [archaeon]|nr:hypothetical protein [archaeon]
MNVILAHILSPPFLANNIAIIGAILAGAILVYFGGFVNHRIIFPIADWIRENSNNKLSSIEKLKRRKRTIKYLSDSLSTLIFILYVYFGGVIISKYVINPILLNLKDYILILVIILFILVSYAINNLKLRRKFMGRS